MILLAMKSSVVATILAVAGLSQPAVAFAYGISTSQNGRHLRWDVDAVAFRMDPELIEFSRTDHDLRSIHAEIDRLVG